MYSSLTVSVLREKAKALGLKGYSRLNKADLIEVVSRKEKETKKVKSDAKKPSGVCLAKDCMTRACYGSEGDKAVHCAEHKTEDEVDIKNKTCQFPGCRKQPTFAIEGSKDAVHCAKHKMDDETDVKHKKCRFPGCQTRPIFAAEGSKDAVHCATHKTDDEVDVKNKTCQFPGCRTIPNFAVEGSIKAVHCAKHKTNDEVDVKNKTCQSPGCRTQPTFAIEGSKDAIHCAKHKTEDEVNVRDKTCQFPGCRTIPTFAVEGSKVAVHCVKHKTEDEVDIKSKTCQFPGCRTQPVFAVEGSKVAVHCVKHKTDDEVDVKNKKCQHDGCQKLAHYGSLFKSPIHCAKHKLPNETNKPYPECESSSSSSTCPNPPYYTDDGSNYPKRCEEHALPQDVNIIEQPCSKCNLPSLINDSTKMCSDCSEFFVKKVQHVKEEFVGRALTMAGFEFESADSVPDYACSLYRPDYVIDYPYFKVIVEVDENQHKSYACECEQGRMVQLFQDYGGTPVVFIRYNPDSYKSDGTTYRANKSRTTALIEVLRGLQNRTEPLANALSVCYLFYDGYDGTPRIEPIEYE